MSFSHIQPTETENPSVTNMFIQVIPERMAESPVHESGAAAARFHTESAERWRQHTKSLASYGDSASLRASSRMEKRTGTEKPHFSFPVRAIPTSQLAV